MPVRPPFLAVPIKALCDPDGRLLSADPQLRRLHDESGGVEGGVLAVPKLLELVQLSATTGIRVERLVQVADRTHDVDLWVEAHPGDHTRPLRAAEPLRLQHDREPVRRRPTERRRLADRRRPGPRGLRVEPEPDQ